MSLPQPALIAAVDLTDRAEEVLRRAARLARFGNMRLVIAHVVEYHCGFESDHVPFMTPGQMQAQMTRDAHAWLRGLAHHMQLHGAEIVVRSGQPAEVLGALVAERHARYVVTGPLKWGAISKLAELARDHRLIESRCDVLHTGGGGKRVGERLWRWLAGQTERRAP